MALSSGAGRHSLRCLSSQEGQCLHSGCLCLFYGNDLLRDLGHSPVLQQTGMNAQEGWGWLIFFFFKGGH